MRINEYDDSAFFGVPAELMIDGKVTPLRQHSTLSLLSVPACTALHMLYDHEYDNSIYGCREAVAFYATLSRRTYLLNGSQPKNCL